VSITTYWKQSTCLLNSRKEAGHELLCSSSGNVLNTSLHLQTFPKNAEVKTCDWIIYTKKNLSRNQRPRAQNNAIGDPNSAFPAVS